MIRIFTSKTQVLGEKGEEAAVSYLKKQGFSIIQRNCANKFGEIDIVAKKKGIMYFFEVKAGYTNSWINPSENLTRVKLQKFFKSIDYYCFTHNTKDYKAQGVIVLFDINGGVVVESIDLF